MPLITAIADVEMRYTSFILPIIAHGHLYSTTHRMYSIAWRAVRTGPRYIDAEYIGEGAYGTVVSALDTATLEKVNDHLAIITDAD